MRTQVKNNFECGIRSFVMASGFKLQNRRLKRGRQRAAVETVEGTEYVEACRIALCVFAESPK